MCKGADSIVLPRCSFQTPSEISLKNATNEHLE